MKQGFLRISRNIVDWDWYTDANTFRVFMHLLLTANYKDCNYKGVEVKRGQVATSRMEIAKALRMSEQNVRTSLSHLKSTSEITSKSTNKLTIITLCKYDSWQDLVSESNQQTNRESTDNLTVNQPAIEEESNKYNNNNKEKEDTKVSPKKKSSRFVKPTVEEVDSLFEKCWIAYRRKGSKKKSFEYWGKLTDDEKQLVLPHIKAYVDSRDMQYQKDFERYLRDKIFLSVVFKNNSVIYDPTRFESAAYTPQGRSIWFDEKTKAYWTDDNFYYGVISDGYTDEDRPDGATLTMSNARGIITWNGSTKKWEKQ